MQRRLKKLRERELVLPPDGVFWGGGSTSESDSSASEVECPAESGLKASFTKSSIQALSWVNANGQ